MNLFIYKFILCCLIFLPCFLYIISISLKCTFGLNIDFHIIIIFHLFFLSSAQQAKLQHDAQFSDMSFIDYLIF
jgi:hypothetical protein